MSASGFAAVADGEDHDLFAVVVIQDDVGALAEFDDPFSELRRQFFDGTANLRMSAERFDALSNCLNGSLGRVLAFGGQKIIESSHIQHRRLRSFQSWHLGMGAFFPASSFASHLSASPAVIYIAVA